MDTKRKLSSQVAKDQKRTVYARMRLLSKIVHGMSKKLMESESNGLGFELEFDPSHCYVIATGLTSKALAHYRDGNFNYYENAPMMDYATKPLFQAHGFRAMHFYDTSTDVWNIIVSPDAAAEREKDVLALACGIQERVQDICNQCVLKDDRCYCVMTTVSDRISSYAGLVEGFQQAYQLRLLDFFCMEPGVINRAWYESRKKDIRRMDISEIIHLLDGSVLNGETEGIESLIRRLTMLLMDSLDMQLVDDIGSVLGHHILNYESLTHREQRGIEGRRLSTKCFSTLTVMMEYVQAVLMQCAEAIRQEKRHISGITKNAVQYIHEHFRESISQQEVAQAVRVVPQYLSSVFNRDMGIGIPAYINNLRIREAQALLRNTDMKISAIARCIGLNNTDCFYAMFKRITGMSASAYRAKYTLTGRMEK